MKAEVYTALLKDLQRLQKGFVQGQVAAVRSQPALMKRMETLHDQAEVGGRLDDFVAMLARKSTVLFLLRTVFVRVLEDLGILGIKRIRDDWGFAAFREVAPTLGKRAYFEFVFKDLAIDFPALFAPGDDELPLPDEDACRALWDLWHHPNRNGEYYTWNGDGFESRFLGDLYQDLDADIRKRYALLQTPRFVEEYILDHTLTPALKEFDPKALHTRGETFRVLDPTCGSGHFLIGAFHRLADYWGVNGLAPWEACERALENVWGADINPHAVDIAHVRLLLEVVARTGVTDLDRLAKLTLNLRAMDSLIPWERGARQGDLFPAKDKLDAYATPEQRQENAAFLGRDFHVVVGNPPYITPKDVRKRDDYREFWPDSAAGKYALSAPFAERIFSMGVSGAFSGQITANSFMKREFGKKLVTVALPRYELTGVIDTSGAYIPGHGTPTVILFGRNRKPQSDKVWAVLGKRGEPKRPADPRAGLVWSAIARLPQGSATDDSLFVTSDRRGAEEFQQHPWSLGGGEAGGIKSVLDEQPLRLHQTTGSIGNLTKMIQDDVYFGYNPSVPRSSNASLIGLLEGDRVRDWCNSEASLVIYPYKIGTKDVLAWGPSVAAYRHFWSYRELLMGRLGVGFRTVRQRGLAFFEYPFYAPETTRGLGLCFGFVSTHNHFVLDRGGKVFKQSAPVIKLPAGATLEEHLDLLGLLNSSALGFWMKQVFHNKGSSSGEAIRSEDWEPFWEYDSTKLQQAPLTPRDRDARIALAAALDQTAQARAACLPSAILAAGRWSPDTLGADLEAAHTHYLALTREMVALQEELDWLTYQSYGLVDRDAGLVVVGPHDIEPLAPGHRPFEIVHARKDDEADDDEKSAWWSRHGHDRVSEIPAHYSEPHRARLQQRIDLIENDPRLGLLETPPYKRRWQLVDWPSEVKQATEKWLLDRLEDLFAPSSVASVPPWFNPPPPSPPQEDKKTTETQRARREGENPSPPPPSSVSSVPPWFNPPPPSPEENEKTTETRRARRDNSRGPLADPKPYRLEDITSAWQRDPRVPSVAGIWNGTGPNVDVTLVAEKLLRDHAVPDNPHRVYTDEGLRRLGDWKRVWALQDQEDAWERAGAIARERGEPTPKKVLVDPDDPDKTLDTVPLPPKFERTDFVRADYFSTRGKLNVPRERFILFAELSPQRFGWNGWRDRDRALAQAEAFALAETDPQVPLPTPTSDDPRRCGVTFGLWESLPDVKRWGDPEEHAELAALAHEACRQSRCPCPILEAWKTRVLSAERSGSGRGRGRIAAPNPPEPSAVQETEVAPETQASPRKARTRKEPVTLGERAWVMSLFSGSDLDLGGIWQRHLKALEDAKKPAVTKPEQLILLGPNKPKQLAIPEPYRPSATEFTGLTEAHLARVVDDLVASGDLQATGRGTKKRFQTVARGVS